jgi:16S rRNA G966 N2-methylase RsmD
MAEIYFSQLKKILDESQSRYLRRVTFVANDATTYGILQQNLFLRFPDELDEEGF